jgi:hypothetical protein
MGFGDLAVLDENSGIVMAIILTGGTGSKY